MKYQNATAFRNHLMNAAPDHLSEIYFIGMSDPSERSYMMKKAYGMMQPGEGLKSPVSLQDLSFSQLLEKVQTKDLFSADAPLWIDDLDLLKKGEIEPFFRALQGRAVLGAGKAISLPLEFQKTGVSLELFSEKPWDKDRRIYEEVEFLISSQGKRVSRDALSFLVQRREGDLLALEKEVEKLLSFVGDRAEIAKQDIEKIVPDTSSQTHWAMVEELVWSSEAKKSTQRPIVDATFFYGWLSMMRNQMQLGYKIASLIENAASAEEIKKSFPEVWPKTLERKKAVAKSKGSSYFKRGLELLFEIEVLSKDGVSSYEALLDLFQSKMMGLIC